jgi:FKBP-type peptidyl-prolyl cis-trans isomerase FkpA
MKAFQIKRLVLLALILTILPACLKDDDGWEKEQKLLKQYLTANNITVEPKASGLYFLEELEGTGASVEPGDYLIIQYTARLLSGTIYDSTDSLTAVQNGFFNPGFVYGPLKFKLSNVTIIGVKEGLTYMKEGGKARLIIPSKIGFGPYSTNSIPAYSTLIYDIELIEVIKDPVAHEAALLENYLIENDITIDPTASGLYFIEELEGTGNFPVQGNTCVVNFTGRLIDGRIFAKVLGADTYSFTIGITEIIAGFQEGVYLMKPGGKAIFIIPSDIAYGPAGSQNGVIPPYSTLIYEVELKQVN